MYGPEFEKLAMKRLDTFAATFPYGVSYLDDALLGVSPNELILVGAKTGKGKTQLATQIALNASRKGRKVTFFALEADSLEIEARLHYGRFTQKWIEVYPNLPCPRYLEWVKRADPDWVAIEKEVAPGLSLDCSDLRVVYKQGRYSPAQFLEDFKALEADTDLFIIDHLHYFDMQGTNESEALKEAIHTIRDASIKHSKPVILLAHLRKSDRKSEKSTPDIEDFHGHSDIVKVATTVLLLSPAKQSDTRMRWPTFFHIAKCRAAGELVGYAGLVGFDFNTNSYRAKYELHETSLYEDPKPIQRIDGIPLWAQNAIKPVEAPMNLVRKYEDRRIKD